VLQSPQGEDFRIIPTYTDRNSYRMPAYNRLDLGFVINFKHKWGTSDLTISVYNAYDRRNPYFLYIDDNRDELIEENNGQPLDATDLQNIEFQPKQVSLFPILPSVTWNFKF
jgi:hypothetical protein